MNFSDRLPSKQWAALTFRGVQIAEVWFKPDDEPLALVFRISRDSFQIPDISQRLTTENLLKAVAVAAEEIESWRHGDAAHPEFDGRNPGLSTPLPQPPLDGAFLELHVRLKPPSQAEDRGVDSKSENVPAEWHDLEARWKAVLGLEATVEMLRKSLESLRAELEASQRKMLPAEEKVHALAADVAQWNKAKNRAHYALPKASEFIHRATWALGAPERKKLGELFKDPIESQASLPPADQVVQELEYLRKDRQVLSAQGVTVYQECKAISADVQAALRRLQSNAAARATKKGGSGAKGKSY